MKEMSQKNLLILSVLLSFIVGGFAGATAKSLIEPRESRRDSEKAIINIERKEEDDTENVVAKGIQSVVSIIVEKEIETGSSLQPSFVDPFEEFRSDPFFKEFFPEFRIELDGGRKEDQKEIKEKRKVRIGGGTGFIVSSDGMIVTNKHVVADKDAVYTVVLNDKRRFPAAVLASDPVLDLAVIKIEAKNLPVLTFGDSEKLRLGETVIAIGYSLGEFSNTVTKGVVSGKGRRIIAGGIQGGSEVIEEAIQTDAAINPGNSGGPLLNLNGQVVGINSAISSVGQSVGFAIPSNTVKKVVESVIREGRIVRPWLGVRYLLLNLDIKKQLEDRGIQISDKAAEGAILLGGEGKSAVEPASPAEKAGLKENDIILKVGNKKVGEENSLASLIAAFKPGDTVILTIMRGENEIKIEVKLAEFPVDIK